jgi:hypothetical protein
MPESAGDPAHDHALPVEPFMVVDRISQELITQQLHAALEQLDIIANAIREDDEAASLSLIYVSAVNARAHLAGVLKQLPWAPIPAEDRRRAVIAPPPRADERKQAR